MEQNNIKQFGKQKGKPQAWEKTFIKHKGLISLTYTGLLDSTIRKRKPSLQKGQKIQTATHQRRHTDGK